MIMEVTDEKRVSTIYEQRHYHHHHQKQETLHAESYAVSRSLLRRYAKSFEKNEPRTALVRK